MDDTPLSNNRTFRSGRDESALDARCARPVLEKFVVRLGMILFAVRVHLPLNNKLQTLPSSYRSVVTGQSPRRCRGITEIGPVIRENCPKSILNQSINIAVNARFNFGTRFTLWY